MSPDQFGPTTSGSVGHSWLSFCTANQAWWAFGTLARVTSAPTFSGAGGTSWPATGLRISPIIAGGGGVGYGWISSGEMLIAAAMTVVVPAMTAATMTGVRRRDREDLSVSPSSAEPS